MYNSLFSKGQAVTPSDSDYLSQFVFEPEFVAAVASTSVDLTANSITKNGHGLIDNDKIVFTDLGSVTGITIEKEYFVVSSDANTFKASLSLGGAAVDLTGTTTTPPTYQKTADYVSKPATGGLLVTAAGTVRALPAGHANTNIATEAPLGAIDLGTLAAGTFVPGDFKKVFSTGTTATVKLVNS
jgi:hypothetical protein